MTDQEIINKQEKEIKSLCIRLAGETLRADLGWDRYAEVNRKVIARDIEIMRLNEAINSCI